MTIVGIEVDYDSVDEFINKMKEEDDSLEDEYTTEIWDTIVNPGEHIFTYSKWQHMRTRYFVGIEIHNEMKLKDMQTTWWDEIIEFVNSNGLGEVTIEDITIYSI